MKKLTIKGLTCNGFATKSELGLKTNDTLSPHGVLVTLKTRNHHYCQQIAVGFLRV